MNLYTCKRIHDYSWDKLPTDDHVIERVESMEEVEDQPLMHDGYPIFEWTPGQEITDGEEI